MSKPVTLLAWVDIDSDTGEYVISGSGNLKGGITDRSAAVKLMRNPVKVQITYTPPGPVPVVAKEVK